jgi:hypothetical protein
MLVAMKAINGNDGRGAYGVEGGDDSTGNAYNNDDDSSDSGDNSRDRLHRHA